MNSKFHYVTEDGLNMYCLTHVNYQRYLQACIIKGREVVCIADYGTMVGEAVDLSHARKSGLTVRLRALQG